MHNRLILKTFGRGMANLVLVGLLGGCNPQIIRSETPAHHPYPLEGPEPAASTGPVETETAPAVALLPTETAENKAAAAPEAPQPTPEAVNMAAADDAAEVVAMGSIFADDPEAAERELEAHEKEIIAEAQVHIEAAVRRYQVGDMKGTLAEFEMAEAALSGLEEADGDAVVSILQSLLPEALQEKDLIEIYDEAYRAAESQEATVDVEELVESSGELGGPQGLGEPSIEESTPTPEPDATPEVVVEDEPLDNPTFIRAEIERIALAFGEEEVLEHDTFQREVERFIHYYQTQKRGFFERSLARSAKYMSMVEEVLQEKGVPSEMAYIAFVESGFRPGATSPAGARGLWQFMPRTARAYGMQVDKRVDQRIDPFQSTIAAREYFLDLVAIFGSRSFLLAMASYNAGEGRVQGCLKALDDPFTQRTFWHIAPCLRRETQEYIPRIIAAAIIASEPERFGFTPFGTIGTDEFEVVAISKSVSLARLARWSDISVQRLREMNPDLAKSATSTPSNQNPYLLVVPEAAAEVVEEELAALKAGVAEPIVVASAPKSETMAPAQKKARDDQAVDKAGSGKKAGATPRKEKEPAKPAPQAIKAERNRQSTTVKKAERQVEPAQTQKTASKKAPQGDSSGRTKFIRYRVQADNSLAQVAEDFGQSEDKLMAWNPYLQERDLQSGDVLFVYDLDWSYQRHQHQVKGGDTLLAISEKYGAPAAQIARWNGVEGDRIFEGQNLVIYTHAGQRRESASRRSPTKAVDKTTQRHKFIYVVQDNNNLTRLSGYFGVRIEDMMAWNRLEGQGLYVGQKLEIYTENPVRVVEHKVEAGESLGALSQKYNVVLTFLADTNGLSRDAQLQIGDDLTVYIPE